MHLNECELCMKRSPLLTRLRYPPPPQACTEMVMPMCSNGVYDMFSKHDWNLTAYEEGCMQQFGVKPQPDLIKKLYGGKDIGGHSNIIFR